MLSKVQHIKCKMRLLWVKRLRINTTKPWETKTAGVELSFCPLILDTTEVRKKVGVFYFLVKFHLQEAKIVMLDTKACHIPAETWLPSLHG